MTLRNRVFPEKIQDKIVLRTARFSIGSQIALTLVTAAAVFVPLPQESRAITEIASIETIAQVVEFVFYAVSLYYFRGVYTWTRYIDWFLSTPVMLISTIAFLLYLKDSSNRLIDVFNDANIGTTLGVLGFNWLMLIFGLIAELDATARKNTMLIFGTGSFICSFVILALFVRGTGLVGISLYTFIYIVWGLYGVAATQPIVGKNVFYNLLDIASKNFYGAFIFVYALTLT